MMITQSIQVFSGNEKIAEVGNRKMTNEEFFRWIKQFADEGDTVHINASIQKDPCCQCSEHGCNCAVYGGCIQQAANRSKTFNRRW